MNVLKKMNHLMNLNKIENKVLLQENLKIPKFGNSLIMILILMINLQSLLKFLSLKTKSGKNLVAAFTLTPFCEYFCKFVKNNV